MEEKLKELEELEQKCAACTACALHTGRTKSVFGVGNPHSPLMFVGEGPGEQEDLKGQPFVGRAGQLLDKFLSAIELDRTGCYIANMVKCRPPKNRDPLPDEQEQCIAYLREQFKLIRPKMVVCLGRIAAQRLISPDFKVTLRHGEWILRGESLFMGTFHPASLLRNPRQKPDAFSDFLKIREKLKELTGNG